MKPRASTCKGRKRRYHIKKQTIIVNINKNNKLNADLTNLHCFQTPVKQQIEFNTNSRPMTAPRIYRGRSSFISSTRLFLTSTPAVSKIPLKPILFNAEVFITGMTASVSRAKRGIQVMLSNKKAYINRVESMYESKRSQSVITLEKMSYDKTPVNDIEIQGSHILLKKHRIGN